MTKPVNLVHYLDRLSDKQKAVIVRCVNMKKENDGEQAWVHLGILPFVTLNEAYGAVSGAYDRAHGGQGERYLAQILSILTDGGDVGRAFGRHRHVSVQFQMKLNDRKVYRQFGKSPERGKVMGWMTKQQVTVGFTNRFGRVEPDTDVWVAPCVRLVKTAPGFYTVEVLARCEKQVREWLLTNCS